MKQQDAKTYSLEIGNIAAKKIGSEIQIQIGEYSFAYNPLMYVRQVLALEGSTEELQNVCIALYDYYLAAKEYFQN